MALIGLVFTNGILEAVVATVAITPLVKVLEPMMKQMGFNNINMRFNQIKN
nr:hypothetical protein [Turicibacter sp.]